MYPPGYSTFVVVERLTSRLEGAVRPGHFRGVATVVVKLLNAVKPHVAVFGQKDAQQVVVIRRLVRDLNIDTDLVIVPTVREPDGLALSSRNAYLTSAQRALAPVVYRSLRFAEERLTAGTREATSIRDGMRAMIEGAGAGPIDYISLAHGETLEELDTIAAGTPVLVSLAVRFGQTRLIDNITLHL
jgi:pantoate--beta-alanine ligase